MLRGPWGPWGPRGPAAPLTPPGHPQSRQGFLRARPEIPPTTFSLTTSTLTRMLTSQVFFRKTRRLKMEGSPLWEKIPGLTSSWQMTGCASCSSLLCKHGESIFKQLRINETTRVKCSLGCLPRMAVTHVLLCGVCWPKGIGCDRKKSPQTARNGGLSLV